MNSYILHGYLCKSERNELRRNSNSIHRLIFSSRYTYIIDFNSVNTVGD